MRYPSITPYAKFYLQQRQGLTIDWVKQKQTNKSNYCWSRIYRFFEVDQF